MLYTKNITDFSSGTVLSFKVCNRKIFSINRQVYRKKIDKNADPWESPLTINTPEFDLKYLCDYNNLVQIKENIERRKGVGDIDKLVSYYYLIKNISCNYSSINYVLKLLFSIFLLLEKCVLNISYDYDFIYFH